MNLDPDLSSAHGATGIFGPRTPEVITVREAAGAGTTLRRLRGPSGERHLYGLYSPERRPRDPDDLHRALLRAATTSGVDVASHRSAAFLWGFPDVRRPRELELLSTGGDRRRRVDGMSGRRGLVLPEEATVLRGIPVTTPARTWLDLARGASIEQLVIWADWLFNPVWGGNWEAKPYSTPGALEASLARHRGKPGIRAARAAAERARLGSNSPQETRLRLALVDSGLPEPAVNQWIVHPVTGERLHQGDLTYDDLRIDLEYEGDHHSEPGQVQRDIARSERLRSADWLEVRLTAQHSRNHWRPAIEKTKQALLSRGWTP